jgi:hypothetical protein
MTRLWVGVIAFAGGVAVGLFAAKLYAANQVSSGIHGALQSIGLGGGTVEAIAQDLGGRLI